MDIFEPKSEIFKAFLTSWLMEMESGGGSGGKVEKSYK
jgi:hypothetical protein